MKSDIYYLNLFPDKCDQEPGFCLNGTTCEPTRTSARCHCTPRFRGDRCNQCPERFQGNECDTCASGYYGDMCGKAQKSDGEMKGKNNNNNSLVLKVKK